MATTERGYFNVRIQQDGPISLDVQFSCDKGEILALVGPSGSGKSTVLKTIAGLYRPQRGCIEVGERTWFDTARGIDLPVRSRSVGMVFQDYALFPHLSAVANVAEAMQHLPSAQRLPRARELLARVHLSGLEQRRPGELSGGQQQRVAVARALARDPEVLLLDEPFSAVDQVTREKLVEELALLHQELPLPIILVTHSLQEAAMLAARMCILHRGRTLQVDTPEAVMNRPATLDVARLVAMRNIFQGRVLAQTPGTSTRIGWGPYQLDARHDPRFTPGDAVYWMVPDSQVVMHRTAKPRRDAVENLLQGEVVSVLALGATTQVKLRLADGDAGLLAFSVPTHFARYNNAAPGMIIEVSLNKDAIHLLPPVAAPA